MAEESNISQQFMEGARSLVFETYCRIHKTIDIAELGSRLNLNPDETEAKLDELICSSKVDASIDTEKSQLCMNLPSREVYQEVYELTKHRNIEARTRSLIQQVEKKYALIDNDQEN